jgi:hypothetical protein
MRLTIPAPAFDGVGAGQTARTKLPPGWAYHDLYVTYAGATLAQILEARVLVNSEVIQRVVGADLDSMGQHDGRAAAGGILTIPFDRYGLLNRTAEEETALVTGVVGADGRIIKTLELELDIDAAAVGTALSARMEVSRPDPRKGPGTILRLEKHVRSIGGAGELQINDLPKGDEKHMALNRLFIKSAQASRVIIKRDNVTIFDRTATQNNRLLNDGVRTAQANWFVIDTTEKGYGGDVIDLVGVNDLSIAVTMDGADAAVEVYPEYLGRAPLAA